jgi:sugar phosphate isomerase/epimerase
VLGVNFDPSHLFWQGIDPLAAVRALGPAIHHVHAKDTALHPANVAVNGVLDLESPSDIDRRSWIFRSVGDGHDLGFWTAFIDALRDVGYDHVLSIEHEDRLATTEAGLARAVATLRAALGRQPSPAGEPA